MFKEKKLYRSSEDKVICGLCSGLGEYFNIDPTIVRIVFILFFIINPTAAVLFYILACAIIPEKPASREKSKIEKKPFHDQGLIILGLILILVGVLIFPEIKLVLRMMIGGLAIAAGLLVILFVLFKKKH